MPINKMKNFSQMLVEFHIFVPSVTNSDIPYVIKTGASIAQTAHPSILKM